MANSGWLTAVMKHGSDRAFSNLYDVLIEPAPGGLASKVSGLADSLKEMRFRIERVDFDALKVDTEYSEAQKMNYLKGVNRIKTVSLSIWETGGLNTIGTFVDWISSYYNFEKQYFIAGDPTATIT